MGASREKKVRRELRAQMEAEAKDKKKRKKKSTGKKNDPGSSLLLRILAGFVIALVTLGVVTIILVVARVPQQILSAITVGDVNVSPAEYSIFYGDTFYNLYSYQTEQGIDLSDESMRSVFMSTVDSLTEDNIREVATLSSLARKENMELSEAYQTTLASELENLANASSQTGVSVDQYLSDRFGAGVNRSLYEKYLTNQFLALQWRERITQNLVYDQDQLETFYSENPDVVDTVTVRQYWISVESYDTAAENADELLEQAQIAAEIKVEDFKKMVAEGGEAAFNEAVLTYASEEEKEYIGSDVDSVTLARNKSFSEWTGDQNEWLKDPARASGDLESFPSEDGMYYQIIYFVSRQRDDYYPVTVRHVLFFFKDEDGESTSTPTEQQKADAWTKARNAYDEWKAGVGSEDSFAALANESSDDRDTSDPEAVKEDGGLYENIVKGQMVVPFENWCFDPARKVGDSGLVETNYGVHIMYFVSRAERPYWQEVVRSNLEADAIEAEVDKLLSEVEVVVHPLGMRFATKSTLIPSSTVQ